MADSKPEYKLSIALNHSYTKLNSFMRLTLRIIPYQFVV